MSLMDTVVMVGVLFALIQTVYIAMTFHSSRIATGTGSAAPLRRHFLIVAALGLATWGAIGADFYLRPRQVVVEHDPIRNWGRKNLAYWIEVNTGKFMQFRDTHKLVLILNMPFADIDRMTDKRIAKSSLYSITGNFESLAATIPTGFLNGLSVAPGTYLMNYHVGLLPNGVDLDRLSSLRDIERLGGRLIGTRGINTEVETVAILPGQTPPQPEK